MINNPSLFILIAFLVTLSTPFILRNSLPYNVNASTDYAYLSGLAYCPKKCLENWSCQSGQRFKGIVDVGHINNDLTLASCFIAYNRDTNEIILSFRGSANIENWLEDFNIEMVSYGCKGCEIHAGFLEDYRIIEAKINAKIEELLKKYPSAKILSTGHSMGAALSEIAGLRLKQKFNVQVDIHNFGCPRVGNSAMAQYIYTKVDSLYRVVHHKDIVPHLPPENYYYHHPPFEVFWDEPMTSYVICSEAGEDKKCSNQYAPSYSAADHSFYFIDLGSLKC
jgi:hypothetical protein